MNAGPTSERVYDGLKRLVLSGDLIPGEKLDPAHLADHLTSSVTPVRDALHRLTGELLVETRASEGFYLPIVTEPALRDLYAWSDHLIRSIIRSWPSDAAIRADGMPVDIIRATPTFFELVAGRSLNAEHGLQATMLNDRLAAARVAETKALPEVETELRAMAVAFDTETPAALLKLVSAYHRRRHHATPAIVRALYRR